MTKKFDVIFENDDLIAVNKPSGMFTIPDREGQVSLKDLLAARYGNIFTVHRIDRDTSGLVLFAKNSEAHRYLSRLFEERKIEKSYAGIVIGKPLHDKDIIDAPIAEHPVQKGVMTVSRNGKPSQTGYEVIDGNRSFSLLSFQLFTGRTHQIRVHAKHIGCPLACDPIYGDGKPVFLSAVKRNFKLAKKEDEERPMISRLALHSFKLEFIAPDGKMLKLTAPLPKEFTALMKQIRKAGN